MISKPLAAQDVNPSDHRLHILGTLLGLGCYGCVWRQRRTSTSSSSLVVSTTVTRGSWGWGLGVGGWGLGVGNEHSFVTILFGNT